MCRSEMSVALRGCFLFSLLLVTVQTVEIFKKKFHLEAGNGPAIASAIASSKVLHKLQCARSCVIKTCTAFSYTGPSRLCHVYNAEANKHAKLKRAHDGTQYYYINTEHETALTAKKETQDIDRLFYCAYQRGRNHRLGEYLFKEQKRTTYMKLAMRMVADMAYAWTTRRLFIATIKPRRVFSVPLESSRMTDLKKNINTQCLGLDAERNIIFIGHELQQPTLSKMTTDGKDWETIYDSFRKYTPLKSLAVDLVYKRCFACDERNVISLDYDGNYFHILIKSSSVTALAVHPSGEYIFYNTLNTMINVSLSNTTQRQLTKLKYTPQKFVICRDRLYMVPFRKGNVAFVVMGSYHELDGSMLVFPKGILIAIASNCGH